MTIEQTNVVDLIGHDEESNRINLVISDHLEWDDKNEKLLLLQEKINSYLAFLEGGEIYEHYPDAEYEGFVIELVSKYEPNEEAEKFLNLAKNTIIEAGFNLKWGPLNDAYENS
jgi:HEPN domain-containing protein